MIRTYHSKWGAVTIDTDNVTDEQLAKLDGMTPQKIAKDVANNPEGLAAEVAKLKARLERAGL